MLAISKEPVMARSGRLSVSLRRYCGDWLAQFLWAIENGLEEPVDHYAPQRPYAPRARGALDPRTGRYDPELTLRQPMVPRPELLAYVCYLPPMPRLEFAGKRVYLWVSDVPLVLNALEMHGLSQVWAAYRDGGTYQIYAFHRTSGSMQLTPKARRTPGIEQVPEVLAAWFEKQVPGAGD